MKFNFRKIASVFASAVMLGSTVGIAAAASYPTPFTGGDVAIVYTSLNPTSVGSASDLAAATSIQADLAKSVTTTSTATIGGEAKAVETSGQKLYLGDYMNGTKEAFTKTELPTILADGTVNDEDGTAFDYTQKILVPNTRVLYGKTIDNLATPVLYVDFSTSSQTYSDQIVFPTAINSTKLANKDITLFGKKYTFTGSASDLTKSKVVLFENSEGKTIKSGESTSVTVGGTSYDIAITSVESDTKAVITVNGVSQTVTESNSYKVAGLDVYIKSVIGPNVAGETRAVEVYVGSSKLVLEDGNSVVKGTKTIYGTTTTITESGGKISKISVAVTPYSLDDRVRYLKLGDTFSDPVFGAFKITFSSASKGLDDSSKDSVEIKASGEQKGRLKFTNKAGKDYDQEMFKPSAVTVNPTTGLANASSLYQADTTYSKNATTLGFDTYDVIASATGVAHENDYVITRNNEYSQIWQVSRIDVVNKRIVMRDMGGSDQTVSLSDATIGSTATLSLADGSTATLNMTGNGTSNALNITVSKADPVLYTKGGAKIDLSHLADPVTYNQSAGQIIVTEETSYNDGDFKTNTAATLGTSFNATWLYDRATRTGNDIYLSGMAFNDGTTGISVGDYDTYYLTNYGTFVKSLGQNDKIVNVYYPSTAVSYGVFIGDATKTGGVQVYKDSETSSFQNNNLIVVGGSCVNAAAAKMLGSDSMLCGEDFTAKTGVDGMSTKFIIETLASPYNSGKIAVLIAGWEATDTKDAATKFLEGKDDLTVGKSQLYPVVSA